MGRWRPCRDPAVGPRLRWHEMDMYTVSHPLMSIVCMLNCLDMQSRPKRCFGYIMPKAISDDRFLVNLPVFFHSN